ncbi:hypothetical protein C3731_14995 [Brucella oryzae]|uniref:Uncharacterized protein n=1 Tax=Brucella oryzae TaxID=335286 RepID=A0A2S7IXF3_9HYPH|nr:hypothetical protein C3731_14995 [Brucella oryzae]PWU77149.1 hypothetical protein DK867_01740 [Ochrobactrum sp. POC9]
MLPYRTGSALLQAIAVKKPGIVTLLPQRDNTRLQTIEVELKRLCAFAGILPVPCHRLPAA